MSVGVVCFWNLIAHDYSYVYLCIRIYMTIFICIYIYMMSPSTLTPEFQTLNPTEIQAPMPKCVNTNVNGYSMPKCFWNLTAYHYIYVNTCKYSYVYTYIWWALEILEPNSISTFLNLWNLIKHPYRWNQNSTELCNTSAHYYTFEVNSKITWLHISKFVRFP